jgi:hypothetical protein
MSAFHKLQTLGASGLHSLPGIAEALPDDVGSAEGEWGWTGTSSRLQSSVQC